jgi:AcrR family transcriptional regulator
MSYPPAHREEVRLQIVRSARNLFNRHGFGGVSIDDIMANAGLTRGGFYSYFKSKSELYAEAVTLILREHPVERWPEISIDLTAKDVSRQIINAYLSKQHFEDIDGSCPLAALPSDVRRSDQTVRTAFETVFKAMVGVFEQGLDGDGRPDRGKAVAITALCVGGLVIARALADRTLADEVRNAAERLALELGEWPIERTFNGRAQQVSGAAIRPRGRRRIPTRPPASTPPRAGR